jgi:hypothetical protein
VSIASSGPASKNVLILAQFLAQNRRSSLGRRYEISYRFDLPVGNIVHVAQLGLRLKVMTPNVPEQLVEQIRLKSCPRGKTSELLTISVTTEITRVLPNTLRNFEEAHIQAMSPRF